MASEVQTLPLEAAASDGDASHGGSVARLRSIYERIAPWYDVLDLPFEWLRYRHIRPGIFDAVAGATRLLDCGVGTGRNVPYYPPRTLVTGIDLAPAMLERARWRAKRWRPDVQLTQADVLRLPFANGTFCAATATFLFCVLPDELQVPALREMARVVRPGGRIVLLEYAMSHRPIRRLMMKMWAPWVRLAYGAGFDRRTHAHALAAGLHVESRRYICADIIVQMSIAI
jgi:ubiquinone/menaquinone biosynthesis C-methylase UbiE